MAPHCGPPTAQHCRAKPCRRSAGDPPSRPAIDVLSAPFQSTTRIPDSCRALGRTGGSIPKMPQPNFRSSSVALFIVGHGLPDATKCSGTASSSYLGQAHCAPCRYPGPWRLGKSWKSWIRFSIFFKELADKVQVRGREQVQRNRLSRSLRPSRPAHGSLSRRSASMAWMFRFARVPQIPGMPVTFSSAT